MSTLDKKWKKKGKKIKEDIYGNEYENGDYYTMNTKAENKMKTENEGKQKKTSKNRNKKKREKKNEKN
jgi:hypothetical protein